MGWRPTCRDLQKRQERFAASPLPERGPAPASLRRVILQPFGERGGATGAARDDEDGVVGGTSTDRLGEASALEPLRQRLGLTAAGADDHQLLDAIDAAQELGSGALERDQRRFRIGRFGAGTLIGAVAGALDQPELGDVARDRRLGGVESFLVQTAPQQLLAVERLAVGSR